MLRYRPILIGVTGACLLWGPTTTAAAQEAKSADDVLGILRAAVEYIRSDLPPGPIAVELDPEVYTTEDGREIRYQPFEYPPAKLSAPLAKAIGARDVRTEEVRSCRSPDEFHTRECVVARVNLSNPTFRGDTARVIVVWNSSIWSDESGRRKDRIGYSHSYELLLERAGGTWRVVDVLDEVLT